MISININKSKTITHELRRKKRSEEFAPLDVQVTILSKNAESEAARQVIRDKYVAIQTDIDSASSLSELKLIADLLKQ